MMLQANANYFIFYQKFYMELKNTQVEIVTFSVFSSLSAVHILLSAIM